MIEAWWLWDKETGEITIGMREENESNYPWMIIGSDYIFTDKDIADRYNRLKQIETPRIYA